MTQDADFDADLARYPRRPTLIETEARINAIYLAQNILDYVSYS
jgi:hypothetical protein